MELDLKLTCILMGINIISKSSTIVTRKPFKNIVSSGDPINRVALLILAGFKDVHPGFNNQAKRVNAHLFEGHTEITDYNGKVVSNFEA